MCYPTLQREITVMVILLTTGHTVYVCVLVDPILGLLFLSHSTQCIHYSRKVQYSV
jgi:hypothetical protein